jgi:cell division protein FtsL
MLRGTTILFVLIAGVLSLALFSLKYRVGDLENELKSLNRAIASEQQAIHVLKAEWSHLNDIGRLRSLAERHLGFEPIGGTQLMTLPEKPVAAAERITP